MRFFIVIVGSKEVGNGEMIYEDKSGRCFIGKPLSPYDGEIVVVEATNKPVEFDCHRIIKEHEHVELK